MNARKLTTFGLVVLWLGVLATAGPAWAQGPEPQVVPRAQAKPATPPAAAPTPRPPEAIQERVAMPLADSADNVRVEVTISYQVGNAQPVKRSALLMVAAGNGSSLRAGVNLAVPTTTFSPTPRAETVRGENVAPPAPSVGPMTSYNYRSVGLNVDVNRARIVGGHISLESLSVEFSAVDEKTSEAMKVPSFPTFSQRLYLNLESGKPMIVAQSSDFVDNVERKQTVEVKATIVK
ncbi:MAG TPA: hypothetical protein VGK32_18445 [Vicinamibacterales bacterium]|jgi:hypothetical protein